MPELPPPRARWRWRWQAPARRRRPPRRPRPLAGFTLIELAIVAVLVALMAAAAAPALSAMVQRHRLLAAAHELRADVALAREQAVQHGQNTFVTLQPGLSWCWAVSLGAPVDCRKAATGTAPAGALLVKRVDGERFPSVVAIQPATLALDGRNGLRLAADPVVLATPQGARVKLQLAALGRASLCAPDAPLAGLPHCSGSP